MVKASDEIPCLEIAKILRDVEQPTMRHFLVTGYSQPSIARYLALLRKMYKMDIVFVRPGQGKRGFYTVQDWGILNKETLA